MFHLQLVVGDFGLSIDEQKAQFAIWAAFAAVSYIVFIIMNQF